MSSEWIGFIKNTVAQVACNFTTNRMLTDYCNQYYLPQAKRSAWVNADDFSKAREIALWKKQVRRSWDNISVVSSTQPASSYSLSPDNELKAEVVLNIGDLKPEDIGVEMLFTTSDRKGKLHLNSVFGFDLVEYNDGVATFQASILPEVTGLYQVATRVYPKNAELPHRQDFPLVKWL